MNRNVKKYFVLLALTFSLFACASTLKEIDSSLTAAEMIQRAQEASDKSRYKIAEQYYQAILTTYPDDAENCCAANYEIAFLKYKRKQYDAARTGLQEVLALYDAPNAELLPQKYKLLSNIVLEKIPAPKISEPSTEQEAL